MHIFNYNFLKSLSIHPELVNRLTRLEGLNQRSMLIRKEKPWISENMERIAIVDSVRSSNEIEGICTTDERIIPLLSGSTRPVNHTEDEIVGYRDALQFIHDNHENIELSKESILNIYEILIKNTDYPDRGFKTRDNVIVERDANGKIVRKHPTVPWRDVEASMDDMISSYWEARNDFAVNKLLLIPCFILDFLRIHPFIDGNGRMSRLLTVLLLYQEGYDICRYTSLESKINKDKNGYYKALDQSEQGWFENENDYMPFIEHFLGALFLSYRDFDRRLNVADSPGNKTGRVEDILLNMEIPMSKKDVMSMMPDVSQTLVETVLRKMLKDGRIIKTGSTRNARYIPFKRKYV